MAIPYTPILGTLVYVWDRESDRVLMVLRNARSDDEHLGKYNGLGGKLEADEDVVAGITRELDEEAAITPLHLVLRGTISWPGFGARGEDWFGFVFRCDAWSGEVPEANAEGDLVWIERRRILEACDPDDDVRKGADLAMWEGDRHFLPLVFDEDHRAFHGVMPYEAGRPTRWSVTRLG